MEMKKNVAVFGGNGFVGTHIMRLLASRGHRPTCFSRSGSIPTFLKDEEWAKKCEWKKADALNSETYSEALKNMDSIIITIGSAPTPTWNDSTYAAQVKANGETCKTIIETAEKAGVEQCVLINASIPQWAPSGYKDGKAMAKKAAENFAHASEAHGATILYPGVIYGTRYTKSGYPIPLSIPMMPASLAVQGLSRLGVTSALEWASPKIFKNAIEAPISVENVAAAAVAGATDPSFRGVLYHYSNDEMLNLNQKSGKLNSTTDG